MRVVLIFLLAMAVLAIFGRLRFPGTGRSALKKPDAAPRLPAPRLPAPVICIRCGTPIPGKGACPCGAPRPPGT